VAHRVGWQCRESARKQKPRQAAGICRDREGDQQLYSAQNFSKVNGIIQPLSAIFAPFGFAEHLGCTLGARHQTREMLRKLADLWGVPIRVGIWTQPIGSVMDISGPAFTAFPRGRDLMGARHVALDGREPQDRQGARPQRAAIDLASRRRGDRMKMRRREFIAGLGGASAA
jgi:hypothetical protein